MGRFILVGLLAFAVALVGSAAYAEVQNIKVGGDIDMKAISHNDYDLKLKQKNESGTTGGTIPAVTNDDDADFYLSTAHLTVDADLTDNVSAHVRLLNQRKWGLDATVDTAQVTLDNAYVVLKEFLYSPLTVMVGKQDLQYGNGFIVGPGLLGDPNAIFGSNIGREYSAYNAYDAIRLILDYAPVTVEGLIAKIVETNVTDDDINLYGVVVNYKADMLGISEIEPYWFYKSDEGAAVDPNDSVGSAAGAPRTYEHNRVHTFGIRSAASPIENLSLNGEVAFQIGDMKDLQAVKERKRFGVGADVEARYNWVNVPWTPATGLGWVYYSGEKESEELGTPVNATRVDQGDTFNAWDPMFRGRFHTFIQDFFAGADSGGGLYTTFDGNDTDATTNRHLLYGDLSLKPMEDLTLWGRFTQVWFANEPRIGRSKDAGREVDLKALYDYTEDVQLALYGGWFFPGTYYDQRTSNSRGNDLAWTVGSSAVVKF